MALGAAFLRARAFCAWLTDTLGVHAVFGQITSGIDAMKKIKKDDVMKSVRVA